MTSAVEGISRLISFLTEHEDEPIEDSSDSDSSFDSSLSCTKLCRFASHDLISNLPTPPSSLDADDGHDSDVTISESAEQHLPPRDERVYYFAYGKDMCKSPLIDFCIFVFLWFNEEADGNEKQQTSGLMHLLRWIMSRLALLRF
jgi:hypothetical protein